MAKRRVEQEFAVVGTWEDTNITLTVLENYIPRYFARATTIYPSKLANYSTLSIRLVSTSNFTVYKKKLQNRNRNNRKPRVDADVRAMVRRNFTHEYDFYYFCKQRLYRQYIALKRNEMERFNLS